MLGLPTLFNPPTYAMQLSDSLSCSTSSYAGFFKLHTALENRAGILDSVQFVYLLIIALLTLVFASTASQTH